MTEVFVGRIEDGAEGFAIHSGLTRTESRRVSAMFGRPLSASWEPVRLVSAGNTHDGTVEVRSDLSVGGSGTGLVLRPSGRAVLEDLIGDHGEMLPLEVEGDHGPFWFFNCTSLIDALDWDAMEVAAAAVGGVASIPVDEATGDVLLSTQPIFDAAHLDDRPVFKVPNVHVLFLGRSFVDTARTAGLRGLVYDRIWPTILRADG